MNIKIRKATEEDLGEIIRLYAQPEMDNGKVLSIHEAKVLFKKIETYPAYNIFVATLEGRIVGTFALVIMDNLAHRGAPSGIIEDVAVDPTYQAQGIGKCMLNFAMDICKEAKCYKLALSSNLNRTNAHEFYKSLGFNQHGISLAIHFAEKEIIQTL